MQEDCQTKRLEGVHLDFYIFKRTFKSTILKTCLTKYFESKFSLNIDLSRKHFFDNIDFHCLDLTSFSDVYQVTGYGTSSPLFVHKKRKRK